MAKRSSGNTQAHREPVSQEQRAEFIPYACHYDESTLLTKDGELMQTLYIEGYNFDTYKSDRKTDLREDVRRAFFASALSENLSVTFHIVRRRKTLTPHMAAPGMFASALDAEWTKKHQLQNGYVNDLYITIVHEGAAFSAKNLVQFARSIFFAPEKFYQASYLEKARETLGAAVEICRGALEHYKPRKLALSEEEGIFYSEPLSLLNLLVNLEPGRKMPMPVTDLGTYLSAYPVDIDFNTLLITQPDGRQRHASIFSVKQYNEIKAHAVDVFLQYPGEFIITQQVMLGAGNEFVKSVEYKKYIAELGEDKDFIRFSGIADILESKRGSGFDYSLQQNTVTIIAGSSGQLEGMAHAMMEKMGSVGVVVVREDVMLENIYYSQLPGNFEFLKRQQPINTNRIAGYTTLYDFPTGKLQGNHWGAAVTTLLTPAKNPYFFSFHYGDNGHTMLASPYGAGKTQLLNFLMAQVQRLQPRVIWFDSQRVGEMLVRALGGSYMRLVRDKEVAKRPLNPLLMENTPENHAFLSEWLLNLLLDLDGKLPPEAAVDFTPLVDKIFALAPEQRKLSTLASLASVLPPPLQEYFLQWIGQGRYAHIFDNDSDATFTGNRIEAFDITEMVQDRRPQWAVLSYLMHRVLQSLDGRPTIIVFDEAWTLFDNSVFGGRLGGWMDKMRQKNAIGIFATESIEDISLSPLTAVLAEKTATKIFLPDANATDAYQTIFGLTAEQYQAFTRMEKELRQFFIKQGQESVVAELQLPAMRGMMEVLSGAHNLVTRMENVLTQTGEAPEQWLPVFYQQVSGT